MKISHNKPPHFWIMHKIFKCDWGHTAFAFGDTIYSKYKLPDHLIVHESTHLKQQRHSIIGAWVWLALYLVSKKFRYTVELEAYQNQWQFFRSNYIFREHEPFLNKITSDLSGALYGNIVSYSTARRKIMKHDSIDVKIQNTPAGEVIEL